MTTRLFLVRHGAVSYSSRAGGADGPLNTLGELQTQALARRLVERHAAAIYTSPLRRAAHTAEILAEYLGVPAREDPKLGEFDTAGGTREGLPRALDAVDAIAFAHPGQEAVLVSHSGPLCALLGHFLGIRPHAGADDWPFTIDHCGITVLDVDGEDATVRTLNDTSHLEGLAL